VFAESPTNDQFVQIFKNCCAERELAFDRRLTDHLLGTAFPARGVEIRGCQPRDLIEQALSIARYMEEPRELTTTLLDAACDAYFVESGQGVAAPGSSTPVPL
jgi:hypothetical protein